ncbi:MAG: hypothetical protein ABL962_04360 [Fimbriimonadaceae bacterium]
MKVTINFNLSLSQDQAILADVIRRSEALGHKLGRTALQKIPYFLMRRGVPLVYSFDLYHYGPFCQEILWDAEMLSSMGAIIDEGGHNGGSKYIAGEKIVGLTSEHQAFLDANASDIDEVVKLLAPLDATRLEIVATVDYLYRYVIAGGKPGPHKSEVLRRFMEAKPQYLSREELVSKLYDRMALIKMIGE